MRGCATKEFEAEDEEEDEEEDDGDNPHSLMSREPFGSNRGLIRSKTEGVAKLTLSKRSQCPCSTASNRQPSIHSKCPITPCCAKVSIKASFC